MSDTFNALVNRVAQELLSEGTTDVESVCATIASRHPDAVEAHGQALARDGLRRKVKDLFRRLSEDDAAQLAIPGLKLPTAIAVPSTEAVLYVRADMATWPQLLAGRSVRLNNVDAAQAKLKLYNLSLERLRGLMEDYPERTVAEALRLERDAG